jgi:hypothetical protein
MTPIYRCGTVRRLQFIQRELDNPFALSLLALFITV